MGPCECDCSFRAGPPGFVQVLDARTLRYPEYRGNGVMASLGNIQENPHVGMVFLDFDQERIGLHVNGTARVVDADGGDSERPRMERWVEVRVQEAYIHCRKHLPHLVKVMGNGRAWGTDDIRAKGGDYFGAGCEPRPWVTDAEDSSKVTTWPAGPGPIQDDGGPSRRGADRPSGPPAAISWFTWTRLAATSP